MNPVRHDKLGQDRSYNYRKGMSNGVNDLERRIQAEALVLGLVISLVPLIFRRPSICFGLWIGTLGSIINFRLLAKSIRNLTKPGSGAKPYQFFLHYLIRYGIIGLVLWASVNKSLGHFIGAAAGLFMIKIAIYTDQFLPR